MTGARQVGKTTQAINNFKDLAYLNLDDPLLRESISNDIGLELWHRKYPSAIVDEVQKLPIIFDTIKGVVDKYSDSKYILTGSSQLIIDRKISESLAGRAGYLELYPFSFQEISLRTGKPEIVHILNQCSTPELVYQYIKEYEIKHKSSSEEWTIVQEDWEKFSYWGGMPRQILTDDYEIWKEWLTNFIRTYLERDLREIAHVNNLDIFTRFQRLLANRTAQLLNYSSLARELGISVQTVKNYCNYLQISYQVLLVPPFTKNPGKRLLKSPKVIFIDLGLLRVLTGYYSQLTSSLFENLVGSEFIKVTKQLKPEWHLYHLRTLDGREIDFLLEYENNIFAFECKLGRNPHPSDARALRNLEEVTGKKVTGKFIIYNGDRIITDLAKGVHAVPAKWLFYY
ncbi:ATP-binding protein [bacterium]|nr:ATP-binding protein [bacterium]